MVIATAVDHRASLLRGKTRALRKSVQAMESNVEFLNELNAVTLELPAKSPAAADC